MSASKNILVIGGTSGYGAGVVKVFRSAGHNVLSVGRSSDKPLDVTKKDSVARWFKENIKELDVVIYSAGIAIGKADVVDKDINDMDMVFQVNTIGLLNVLKQSYNYLKKSGGYFFHIGSIAHELCYVGGADYCASKSASNTIMKTIKKEWLGTGIHTTSLEVGLGQTNFQKNRYSGDMNKASNHTNGVRQIIPEDLGKVIEYLSSMPDYLNMDEIELKPLDQASHGISILNTNKQF